MRNEQFHIETGLFNIVFLKILRSLLQGVEDGRHGMLSPSKAKSAGRERASLEDGEGRDGDVFAAIEERRFMELAAEKSVSGRQVRW